MNRILTEAAPKGDQPTHPLLRPRSLLLIGAAALALTVAARSAILSFRSGPDVAKQEAEVRVICDTLSAELRNQPAQEVLARLGNPDRRATDKGYEAWVYTATEGGQFAVRLYGGRVARVGPDLPPE